MSCLRPWGLLAFAAAMLHGCASQPIPPVDDQLITIGSVQGQTSQAITHGHELLVTDCRYCHMPVAPTSISLERWEKALPRMIAKARLTAADEADLRAYILAARALPVPPEPQYPRNQQRH